MEGMGSPAALSGLPSSIDYESDPLILILFSFSQRGVSSSSPVVDPVSLDGLR